MIVCGDKAGFVLEDYEDYGPKTGHDEVPPLKRPHRRKRNSGKKR